MLLQVQVLQQEQPQGREQVQKSHQEEDPTGCQWAGAGLLPCLSQGLLMRLHQSKWPGKTKQSRGQEDQHCHHSQQERHQQPQELHQKQNQQYWIWNHHHHQQQL